MYTASGAESGVTGCDHAAAKQFSPAPTPCTNRLPRSRGDGVRTQRISLHHMMQGDSSVRLSLAPPLLNLDELVAARAQPDLLAMLDHGAPVGVRVREVEVVVLAALGDAALGLEPGLHVREL